MKSFQNWLALAASSGSDMSTRRSSKPYFEKTPAKERSATKTGRCPRSRQACAMPTQLSAGPKAASGKKTIVLPSLMTLALHEARAQLEQPPSGRGGRVGAHTQDDIRSGGGADRLDDVAVRVGDRPESRPLAHAIARPDRRVEEAAAVVGDDAVAGDHRVAREARRRAGSDARLRQEAQDRVGLQAHIGRIDRLPAPHLDEKGGNAGVAVGGDGVVLEDPDRVAPERRDPEGARQIVVALLGDPSGQSVEDE